MVLGGGAVSYERGAPVIPAEAAWSRCSLAWVQNVTSRPRTEIPLIHAARINLMMARIEIGVESSTRTSQNRQGQSVVSLRIIRGTIRGSHHSQTEDGINVASRGRGLTSQHSGDTTPCVKSLRSSYTGMYPHKHGICSGLELTRFRRREGRIYPQRRLEAGPRCLRCTAPVFSISS